MLLCAATWISVQLKYNLLHCMKAQKILLYFMHIYLYFYEFEALHATVLIIWVRSETPEKHFKFISLTFSFIFYAFILPN